jgi:menaquinone-dependent protoporphyrinogen IX oxidase
MSNTMLIVSAIKGQHALSMADCIATALRSCAVLVIPADAATGLAPLELGRYRGVVMLGSAHDGRLQRELVSFARTHRTTLGRMPTSLIFSSASQAALEGPQSSSAQWIDARADVRKTGERFVSESGVRPRHVLPVAGPRSPSQGSWVDLLLKCTPLAVQPRDDTNWTLLAAFVRQFAGQALRPPARQVRPFCAATA